jgi:hypothetical protein
LSHGQADIADACSRIFKTLDPLLKKEGIHKLNLERMIFSRIGKGVTVHLPVGLGQKVTKKDLYSGAHTIGVLVNTIALFDRLSESALTPGVYLVKVRAISKCAWAFDFIQADGRKALSAPAKLADPERFESVPDDRALGLLIMVPGFDLYIGGDPDTLLPRHDYTVVCISLLYWYVCFGPML